MSATRFSSTLSLVVLCALVLSCNAGAPIDTSNIVQNSGFEDPVVGPTHNTVSPGTTLGSWTVSSSTSTYSHYLGTNYLVHGGAQCIHLVGLCHQGNSGGIEQLLPTVAGGQYSLTFFATGGSWGGVATGQAGTVEALDGETVILTEVFQLEPMQYIQDGDWKEFNYTFAATSSSTLLRFSCENLQCINIDDVTVSRFA